MPPYSNTVRIAGMQLRDFKQVMTCAQPPLVQYHLMLAPPTTVSTFLYLVCTCGG